MIGNSIWEYVFIRASILLLHYVAPLSALACVAVLIIRPPNYHIPLLIEIWAIAELFFLLLVFLPRDLLLQQAASHPGVLPRDKRRELFRRCSNTIENPERYLSLWHRGASPAEIKRENVKGDIFLEKRRL